MACLRTLRTQMALVRAIARAIFSSSGNKSSIQREPHANLFSLSHVVTQRLGGLPLRGSRACAHVMVPFSSAREARAAFGLRRRAKEKGDHNMGAAGPNNVRQCFPWWLVPPILQLVYNPSEREKGEATREARGAHQALLLHISQLL